MARRVVTHSDSGRTITAKPGDEIVITLPEHATSGYEWRIAEALPAGVATFSVPEPPVANAAIGADVPRTIGLRVTSEGTHRIRLLEHRRWEGTDKAINAFDLVISAEGQRE